MPQSLLPSVLILHYLHWSRVVWIWHNYLLLVLEIELVELAIPLLQFLNVQDFELVAIDILLTFAWHFVLSSCRCVLNEKLLVLLVSAHEVDRDGFINLVVIVHEVVSL